MHVRNLLFTVVALTIIGASIGLMGQGMDDAIKVTLPNAVMVGDNVLEPGQYDIRRATSQPQVLMIYSDDKLKFEANVLTIPVVENKTQEDTKVVLHHIGDQYYFDKIWIEGKTYGYEFVLPERVRSLQREILARRTIPAKKVEESAATTPNTTAQDEAAAQAERDRLAQLERDRQEQIERDRLAQIERDRQAEAVAQAERDRQAQADRDREALAAAQAERDRQNQIEQEPVTVARNEEPAQPNRLPATASDWLAYLVGGCLLIGVSMLLRLRTERG